MTAYNGDVSTIDQKLIKELISELQLLRKEIIRLNDHNDAEKRLKQDQDDRARADAALNDFLSSDSYSALLYTPIDSFRNNQLSNGIVRGLIRSGVYRVKDLTFCSKCDVSRMSNIDKDRLAVIEKFLQSNDLDFAVDSGIEPIFEAGQRVVTVADSTYGDIKKGTILTVIQRIYREGRVVSLPVYGCAGLPNLFSRSELIPLPF